MERYDNFFLGGIKGFCAAMIAKATTDGWTSVFVFFMFVLIFVMIRIEAELVNSD